MIYTFTVQKGGTGKTTTAATLAQAAAYKGKTALAIDLDPQANLSFTLAADATAPGSYELLTGEAPARDLIQHSPQGMDVIPASLNLQTIKTAKGSARRLQKALQPISGDYDIIIIDTPAAAGELQYNAIQAAQAVIIPLEAEAYCMQSLYQTAAMLPQFKQSNPNLKTAGVILTKTDGQTNLTKHFRKVIAEKAAELNIPFLGAVRKAIAIREAIGFQQSLYEYAPHSKPAEDYLQIFEKLNI